MATPSNLYKVRNFFFKLVARDRCAHFLELLADILGLFEINDAILKDNPD